MKIDWVELSLGSALTASVIVAYSVGCVVFWRTTTDPDGGDV